MPNTYGNEYTFKVKDDSGFSRYVLFEVHGENQLENVTRRLMNLIGCPRSAIKKIEVSSQTNKRTIKG